jgi:hypothetical protein
MSAPLSHFLANSNDSRREAFKRVSEALFEAIQRVPN